MNSILIDTNIWIDHFKRNNELLATLLEEDKVIIHPFVQGELACGVLKNRKEILELLSSLPQTEILQHHEVLHFVQIQKCFSKGLGWIDAHLLGACILHSCKIWTLDKALEREARRLNLYFE